MVAEKEMQEAKANASEAEAEHINLKVLGADHHDIVQFKIKRDTPLGKLMKSYCDRKKLDIDSIKFVFDGDRVTRTCTPNSLEMEDGDTIEIFAPQTGGR